MKLRPLAPGDLVLRKVLGTTKNPTWGKFGSNWKGPYRITSVAEIGEYYLEDLDENVVPLECKQPEKVLLLMKTVFTIFLVYYIMCHAFYYLLNIKQKLSHVWLLELHTLSKLIF